MGRTRLKIDADLQELTTRFLQDIHTIAGTSAESPAFADLHYKFVYKFQYARNRQKKAAQQAEKEIEPAIAAEALGITVAAAFIVADPGPALYGDARSENANDQA